MDTLDPRAARSRKALMEALLTLALEQSYENLSIRAVTKRAGVGYTTFFRHFESLDNLLGHTLLTGFQNLTQRLAVESTIYGQVVALYSFVHDYPRTYNLFLTLPETHPAHQICAAEAETYVRNRCVPRASSRVPRELVVEHILETSHRLITWYLDHLDECSLDKIVAIHYELVINGTQNIVDFQPDTTVTQHKP